MKKLNVVRFFVKVKRSYSNQTKGKSYGEISFYETRKAFFVVSFIGIGIFIYF